MSHLLSSDTCHFLQTHYNTFQGIYILKLDDRWGQTVTEICFERRDGISMWEINFQDLKCMGSKCWMLRWSCPGELFTAREDSALLFWCHIRFLSRPPHPAPCRHPIPPPASTSLPCSPGIPTENWFPIFSEYFGLRISKRFQTQVFLLSCPLAFQESFFLCVWPEDGLRGMEGPQALCHGYSLNIKEMSDLLPELNSWWATFLMKSVQERARPYFWFSWDQTFEWWKHFLIYIFFDCIWKGLLAWQQLLWRWYVWLVLLGSQYYQKHQVPLCSRCGARLCYNACDSDSP